MTTMKKTDTSGRIRKAIICLPVAAVLAGAFVFLFKIDLTQIGTYEAIMADKIELLGAPDDISALLGRLSVFGMASVVILCAYMLPARLSHTILKTCKLSDQINITLGGILFISGCIGIISSVPEAYSNLFFPLMQVHGKERIWAIALILVAIILYMVLIFITIIGPLYLFAEVIIKNIRINGPVLGIIGAAFEMLSSVFVTAAVAVAYCFGIAIVIAPFAILILLSASSTVDGIVYDEDGNAYYVTRM